MVEKKDTKQHYALKYVSKEHLIHTNTVLPMVREQKILTEVDHPNIMKLCFTFQDEEDVFMVSDSAVHRRGSWLPYREIWLDELQ